MLKEEEGIWHISAEWLKVFMERWPFFFLFLFMTTFSSRLKMYEVDIFKYNFVFTLGFCSMCTNTCMFTRAWFKKNVFFLSSFFWLLTFTFDISRIISNGPWQSSHFRAFLKGMVYSAIFIFGTYLYWNRNLNWVDTLQCGYEFILMCEHTWYNQCAGLFLVKW